MVVTGASHRAQNEVEDLLWADEHLGDDEVLKEVEILLAKAESERTETPKDRLEDCMRNTLRGVQAPAMPCEPAGPVVHREKVQIAPVWGSLEDPSLNPPLAVARKVGRKEIEAQPKAQAAVLKEYNKLLTAPHPDGKGQGVWDMSSVREKSDVRREADKLGLTVFFAMLAELCFLKGSELPLGDPGQVYKGRHVLLGDQVRDGQFEAAEFQDLGSAPPTMMAARIVDLWSLIVGFHPNPVRRHFSVHAGVYRRRTWQGRADVVVSPRAPLAARVERQIQAPGCSADSGPLWPPRRWGVLGTQVRRRTVGLRLDQDWLAGFVHAQEDELAADSLRG